MATDYTTAKTFALAGVSNMLSGGLTNPIDVVKVRMQVDNKKAGVYQRTYPGLLRGGTKIVQTEGLKTLLTAGLLPSLLREGSYSAIRMGGYEPMKRLISSDAALPLYKKIIAGGVSGSIGSFLTTPLDVVKVRLQVGTASSTNILTALHHVYRDEGVVKGLWRGAVPNVVRASITTAAQISSYDHSKQYLLSTVYFNEGPKLHLVCSVIAGFCAATANNPVDVVKSRMQSESVKKGAAPVHSNIVQVLKMVLAKEGPPGLYKGWFPNWCRIAPHTCLTFLVFEKLRSIFGIKPI